MKMSDAIHGLVINNASAPDIREIALEEGMSTLQGSGWEQIKRGFTTFDEVIRYADGFIDEQPATPFEGDETQTATEGPVGG